MKKSLFLIPLALGLFACSNDNLVDNPGQNPNGSEGSNSYLSINISSVKSTGSRAGDGNNPSADYDYDDGIESEYDVKSVGFYFFDGDLNTVKVVNGTSYYYQPADTEISKKNPADTENGNVTAEINAMIVLTNSGEQTSAKYLVAVVNPTTAFVNATKENLQDYAGLQKQLLAEANTYSTSTGFVMSTSVFAADGKIEGPVSLEGKLKDTRDEAIASPAHIYVERVAAKMSVKLHEDLADHIMGSNRYKVLDKDGNEIKYDNNTKNVCVQLEGWDVTATAKHTYVVKNTLNNWASTAPFTGWNEPLDHRSFWALNPSDADVNTFTSSTGGLQFTYGDYNQAKANVNFTNNDDKINWDYMTENAFDPDYTGMDYEPTNATTRTTTKVIVAAKLVDGATGNALDMSQYAGNTYYSADDLREAMANASNIYVRTGDGINSEYVWTPLSDITELAYVELVSAQQLSDESKALFDTEEKLKKLKDQNYYTYLQYKENNESSFPNGTGTNQTCFTIGKFSNYNDDETHTQKSAQVIAENVFSSADALNAYLIKVAGPAKYWSSGLTYYFFDIKHINTAGAPTTTPGVEGQPDVTTEAELGYYGVVRNHWYESSIKAIYGFGTPVKDPGNTIYPQTPDDDPWTYIAADIKVLSWHKVSQDVDLGKK